MRPANLRVPSNKDCEPAIIVTHLTSCGTWFLACLLMMHAYIRCMPPYDACPHTMHAQLLHMRCMPTHDACPHTMHAHIQCMHDVCPVAAPQPDFHFAGVMCSSSRSVPLTLNHACLATGGQWPVRSDPRVCRERRPAGDQDRTGCQARCRLNVWA